MSRIGKLPIAIPSGVEVKVGADVVEVKGAKAALTTPVCDLLSYEVADGHITLTRKAETRESRAQHGLRRTLLANCIEGVTKGFSKTLEVIGVGYRVAVKGNVIELQVGFSHPVLVELPAGLSAKVEGQKLTIMGADKVLVGEMAARIRRIREPEPYKGKGIKYETETILRKATEHARKNMVKVPLIEGTLPYEILGEFGAGRVMLKPASRGTGIIAGGAVRAVMEAAGVNDVLAKAIGTNNPHNVLRATMAGLAALRSADAVSEIRGMKLEAPRK